MKRITLFLLFWILITSSLVFAGTKYAGEFLTVGVGARALGMGGAFVGLADDGTAGYWNPAGLTLLKQKEITIMHASMFADIVRSDYISFALPITANEQAFSISILRLSVDDIPITKLPNPDLPPGPTNRPEVDYYASDGENAAYFSFGKSISQKILIGGNLKAIYQDIDKNWSLGYGADIGLLYLPITGFSIGAIIQDATGTLISWNTGHRDIRKPTFKIGAVYSRLIPFLRGTVTATSDMEGTFEGNEYSNHLNISNGNFGANVHYGAEYKVANVLSLRAGAMSGNLTAGAGIKISRFNIDYAFLSYDEELGNSHRVSSSIKF